MAVGSLGWAAGRLLQAAVSRQREFQADASAVKYTRAVDGLGGALRKIADQQMRGRAGLQSAHAASLAHLLLAHRARQRDWNGLWQTHPPLAERLRRLYGHAVLPVAADVVEYVPDVSDEIEPIGAAMHIAPTHAAGSTGRHDDMTARSRAPRRLPAPSSFDDHEREHEALDRIERWHGPGEWQAAMLALAISPAAPDAAGALGGVAARPPPT